MAYSFYFDWDLDDWLDLIATPKQWGFVPVARRQVLQAKVHPIFINISTCTLYVREPIKSRTTSSIFWWKNNVITDYVRIILTHELIAHNSDCTTTKVEHKLRRAINKVVEELIFVDANTVWRYPPDIK